MAIEVGFKEEEENTKPKALEMKHFYFALGMWVVGILLSVFCLLTEIIVHRLSLSTEEPGVTQSSPELEDGHNSNVEDLESTKG